MILLVLLSFLPLSSSTPSPTSPIITVALRNISVSYGQRAQLFCEAVGYPKPKVRIMRRVSRSKPVLDLEFNDVDRPLEVGNAYKVLNRVTVKDEGWYYCKAKNSLGTQVVRGYVSLRDVCSTYKCPGSKICEVDKFSNKPFCRCPTRHCTQFDVVCGSDCQTYFSSCFLEVMNCETGGDVTVSYQGFCDIPTPPTVNYWQRNITVAVGVPIRLRCEAAGTPPPKTKWFHQIDADVEPVVVSETDLLYINKAQLLDNGLYFCQAQTCGAQIAQSNMFEVRVESPPVLPTCVVAGNGHIRTFDSQSFSFGGTCSYMLARNCQNSDWFIYSRFGDCRVGATCLEALTVYHGRTYFEIGRGWSVNMGFDHFSFQESEERRFPELDMVMNMNGTHLHVHLPKLYIIWDGVTTAHIVLDETVKDSATCGLCGGNYGQNSYKSVMLSEDAALDLVVNSRLDYYQHCPKSFVQTYTSSCNGMSRTEAISMCKQVFACSGFSLCKQVVDVAWYISTCIQDTCNKEYLSAYPSPCRAIAAFKEMCSIANYDVSECMQKECNVKNVLIGSHCGSNSLPFRGCGPTL